MRICGFVIILYGILHSLGCSKQGTKDLPNVILVMTDDQGYGDIGAHGNAHINTPHLNELHANSIRFTDFHVGTTCAPSRAALMTGKDGNKVGVWHTIAGRSILYNEEVTIAEIFSQNGYRTGLFGKWHLGDSHPFRPHERGFNEALYHGGGGVGQSPDYWDNDYFDDTYFRNGIPEKQEGYCTDVWFDEAIKFMSKEGKKPFFTVITPNAPHFPYHVDSSYIKPYLNNPDVTNPNFYGMITNIDDNMGKLMTYLENEKLADNTIVIFMTDNGSAAGSEIDENGHVTNGYNAGMRGKKVWHYDGGHRVPFFIHWPKGNWQGGKDIDVLTAHIDVLPTLVNKLGLTTEKDISFDGWDLSDLLNEDKKLKNYKERILIVDTQRRQHPLKGYKSCVMMDKWRMIDKKELYNLENDPSQKTNIIKDHPEMRVKLSNGYEKWYLDVSPFFRKYAMFTINGDETTQLFAHDWLNAEMDKRPNIDTNGSHITPWNQEHIRKGLLINGIWRVNIPENSTYDITLRRWPDQLNKAINEELAMKQAVHGGKALSIGKALEIVQAEIEINKKPISAATVRKGDTKITFSLQLPKGPQQIKTSFVTKQGEKLGAYYVDIKKAT